MKSKAAKFVLRWGELIAFEEEVGDEKLWRTVESLLEKARIRAWKAANNYHRLKLQNFFVKNNKNNPAWLNKSAQTRPQFSSLFLSQNISQISSVISWSNPFNPSFQRRHWHQQASRVKIMQGSEIHGTSWQPRTALQPLLPLNIPPHQQISNRAEQDQQSWTGGQATTQKYPPCIHPGHAAWARRPPTILYTNRNKTKCLYFIENIFGVWLAKKKFHCMRDLISYIGQTSKTAEKRTIGHLNTILQDCHASTRTPVGQHFCSPGHNHTDLQVTPFQKIYSWNPFVRKARETFLIDRHEHLTKGLNKELWCAVKRSMFMMTH